MRRPAQPVFRVDVQAHKKKPFASAPVCLFRDEIRSKIKSNKSWPLSRGVHPPSRCLAEPWCIGAAVMEDDSVAETCVCSPHTFGDPLNQDAFGRPLWSVDEYSATGHGHSAGVRCVAFSPDGSKIVSASSDGRALVWDARERGDLPVLVIEGRSGSMLTAK